jgi:aminopeptidase N
LLYHIEKVVGGPAIFEPYMKAHVERFASKSITTEQWLAHLHEYMGATYGQEVLDKLKTIDFDLWINKPGMPPVDPQFDTSLADACYNLADRWDQARNTEDLSGFSAKDIEKFTSTQKSKCYTHVLCFIITEHAFV